MTKNDYKGLSIEELKTIFSLLKVTAVMSYSVRTTKDFKDTIKELDRLFKEMIRRLEKGELK